MIYLGVWRALVPLKRRSFNMYSKFAYLRAAARRVCGDNKELFLIECVRE